MHIKSKLTGAVTVLTFASCLGHARADGTSPTPASSEPAWLTDLSAGVKESYDSSVFLSSVDPKYYAGTTMTVPLGSVLAGKDAGSWVTTISPRVGINFVPLLADQTRLQTLSLIYEPDFVFYHEQPSENYDAQRLSASVKGREDDFSFALDDTFAYVDGSKFSPTYPGGDINAWGIVPPRERREQIQDRATVALRYDWNQWFIRPTASLLNYNLMTEHLDVPGYINYVSRCDINGGVDLGYKITSPLAVTLGYRFGHQYQESLNFSPYNSSSDYQRVLAGMEGRPWNWLEFKIQGGPDFRDYGADAPVSNPNLVTYYGEASVTATLSQRDALTVKYKQWQWVSSCGKVPYFDSNYDLNYHRKLTDHLSADLGGRMIEADYTSGDLADCQRDDAQYTVSAGLAYAANSHLNFTIAYALNLGRNLQSGVANPETRDYDEHLISAGVRVKF